MKTEYKHLLFDLGGVLIELGNSPIPQSVLPPDVKISLVEWFASPTVEQFESGQISSAVFASRFIEDLNLHLSVEACLGYFRKWPIRIFPNAESILERLSIHYHLSILSNCNEIHWPIMEHEFGILEHFDWCFSSHLIGVSKPHKAAFTHVLNKLKAHPDEVLFFDDNTANVESARKVGMTAVQVKGTDELEAYLLKYKYL